MTKYEALKQKADKYQNRLVYATAYRDNLENGTIESKTNDPGSDEVCRGIPFKPYLSNRTSTAYGFIDTDEFTEEEMDVLKTLVRSYVARLEQKYEDVAIKLQAIEDLLA